MIDLHNMTDYDRALQFQPSKVLGWMIDVAVFLGIGQICLAICLAMFSLAVGFAAAVKGWL